MPTPTVSSIRLLPDGTPLQNRLLAALPAAAYARLQKHLHMNTTVTGRTLQEHGTRLTDVYFPNGGVFSVTNKMRDGALVEVATVGREGRWGSASSSAIAPEPAERSSRCPMVHFPRCPSAASSRKVRRRGRFATS